MKFKLFANGITPVRKHEEDGGVDIFLPEEVYIKPSETIKVGLGIGVQIPHGYAGQLVPRSSIANQGLSVYTPLIDEGYTGELFLIAQNTNLHHLQYNRGDRICSLVVFKVSDDKSIEIVDEFPETSRGDGCLGSTGK